MCRGLTLPRFPLIKGLYTAEKYKYHVPDPDLDLAKRTFEEHERPWKA